MKISDFCVGKGEECRGKKASQTEDVMFSWLVFFMHFFVQGRRQPTQSQLIQIYSVDWTDIYDTQH